MVGVSLTAAFLGGLLSLLSPCSALLLPAFFAYAFGGGGELAKKTLVFYAGLAATLVPLGMGIAAVSGLFYGHRALLVTVSGLLMIGFGILTLFGRGFVVGPLARLRGRIRGDSGGAVFALGAVYGFAGFCSGPILGAVLTVAAASGGTLRGAALLALYAAGMAAPLFLLALLWDNLDLGRRRFLRGREVRLGPIHLHSTNVLSGLMFVALGVLFIAYEGTSGLEGLYAAGGATDAALAAQRWAGGLPGWLLFAVAALFVAAFLLRGRRSRKKPQGAEGEAYAVGRPEGRAEDA